MKDEHSYIKIERTSMGPIQTGDGKNLLLKNPKLGLVLALVCAGSMWFYVSRILVPYQARTPGPRTAAWKSVGLNPRWLGSRELLHHRNPYSREVDTRNSGGVLRARELDAKPPGRSH